jgi:hypothetical protein
MPGIVSSFCAPLAQAGVEMIYLSTFNTDLILVKEERVSEAYEHVKGSLAFLSKQVEESARIRRAIAAGEIVDRKDNSSPSPLTTSTTATIASPNHGGQLVTRPLDIASPLSASSSTSSSIGTPASASSTPIGSRSSGNAFSPMHGNGNGISGNSNEGDDDNETRMHLSPLVTKLSLLNFNKRHLPLCSHALLSIFLNPVREYDQHTAAPMPLYHTKCQLVIDDGMIVMTIGFSHILKLVKKFHWYSRRYSLTPFPPFVCSYRFRIINLQIPFNRIQCLVFQVILYKLIHAHGKPFEYPKDQLALVSSLCIVHHPHKCAH